MSPYCDDANRPVVIHELLGAGAYGQVYAINAATAVKLYRQPPSQYQLSKLHAMIAMTPPDSDAFIAWPHGIIYARKGHAAGYLMPRLPAGYQAAKAVADTATAQTAAARLLATLEQLHQQGVVLGDINPHNVQVNSDGAIALLDTDGWQVSAAGRLYHAEGYTVGFTHPLLLANYHGTRRVCANRNCPQQPAIHLEHIPCRPRSRAHDRYAAQRLAQLLTRPATLPRDATASRHRTSPPTRQRPSPSIAASARTISQRAEPAAHA